MAVPLPFEEIGHLLVLQVFQRAKVSIAVSVEYAHNRLGRRPYRDAAKLWGVRLLSSELPARRGADVGVASPLTPSSPTTASFPQQRLPTPRSSTAQAGSASRCMSPLLFFLSCLVRYNACRISIGLPRLEIKLSALSNREERSGADTAVPGQLHIVGPNDDRCSAVVDCTPKRQVHMVFYIGHDRRCCMPEA
jgi:hypothetical protein